jgi:hypothetical protein
MAEYAVYIQFNELDKLVINEDVNELKLIKVYPDPIFKEAQMFNDKNRIILIEVGDLVFCCLIIMFNII